MTHRIGALTISQSPRPDLLALLYVLFPEHDILEAGALDDVDSENLPDGTNAPYPLTTRLTNGELVTLDRDFLASLVQRALDRLEAQKVDISILMCAGDFPDLVGAMPIVQPSTIVQKLLRAMGIQHLAVISPIAIQVPPIERKWRQAGFQPTVWTMPPNKTAEEQAIWINSQVNAEQAVACVVLDYVGYPTQSTLTLQKLVDKPVFDLGHLAFSAVSALF